MLGNKKEYSRYYGDFRGVDFSNDHTQVSDNRFAYAVNMYKDYQSGQGKCIETIPGFRRRVERLPSERIWGIHQININNEKKVFVHCGDKMFLWKYTKDAEGGTVYKVPVTLGDPKSIDENTGMKTFEMYVGPFYYQDVSVDKIFKQNGEEIVGFECMINVHGYITVTLQSSELNSHDCLQVWVRYETLTELTLPQSIKLEEKKSSSVIFNNRLYIMDGSNCLVYDGANIKSIMDDDVAYVPTTYIDIITSGENADAGVQKENRNMLSPLFKHAFYADGSAVNFVLNESGATVKRVAVYGEEAQQVSVESYSVDTLIGVRVSFKTSDGKTYESTDYGETWYYLNEDVTHELEGKSFYYTTGIGVTFLLPPAAPLDVGYPESHAGIEITARKQWRENNGTTPIERSILDCTIACVYDNRVFLSGNPRYPNRVFWSALNDPTYFPVINYEDMGVGDSPVTGMIPLPDALMVLKGDTQQDGSVYYLSPAETGDNLAPKVYTKTSGLNGTGCLGACVNFLDDPVFISRFGLEAMGQLSVRLERAIEHRSSLVDAKLTTMDLSRASMIEWNGYLVILTDGKIFMADSRQRYADEQGVMQYEWYYLEDIGIWDGQYTEYRYAKSMRQDMYLEDGVTPRYVVKYCKKCGQSGICDRKNASSFTIDGCGCGEATTNWIDLDFKLSDEMGGEVVNPPDNDGNETETVEFARLEIVDDSTDESGEQTEPSSYEIDVFYHVRKIIGPYGDNILGYEALLCTTRENFTGGKFKPATTLAVIDNNLFFGTENGIVCSFNSDMRNDLGEIPKEYYTFDNRAIFCGVATKMDNCGIPHLTKNTVKKSTVIKTRTMQTSGAKIKVRTNRKPYEQIARISSGQFFFNNVDFSDFSFVTTEHNLFSVREKEKKWVEKQYFLYSDEYMKPFSLFYIAYRYNIVGGYKEPK